MPSKVSPPTSDTRDDMDQKWRPVFDKYDSNHDGLLSLDELKTLIDNGNTRLRSDLPDAVRSEIEERAVWDKNRHLSYGEFLKMVQASEVYSDKSLIYRLMKAATNTVVPKTQRATTLRRYVELYNCRPPPLFMVFITLIEIAVFLYYCAEFKELSAIGPVPINSAFIYNPKRRYEAWRFFTYMLIHAGAIHIFFNVLMQLVIGLPLEMVHKWWRVGLVYLTGVISGSLGSSVSDPYTYLAGASGGVYSLIAAHLANVVINFGEMDFGWVRLVVLIAFAGTDIVVALYSRYSEDKSQQTSYAAHLAGALSGLLVGVVVLRNIKVYKWEKILGWVMIILFFILLLISILINVLCPEYFPEPEK